MSSLDQVSHVYRPHTTPGAIFHKAYNSKTPGARVKLTINCTWHLFLSLIPPTQKTSGHQPQSPFLPWASLEAGSSLCHLIDGVAQCPQVWNVLLLEPRETQQVLYIHGCDRRLEIQSFVLDLDRAILSTTPLKLLWIWQALGSFWVYLPTSGACVLCRGFQGFLGKSMTLARAALCS